MGKFLTRTVGALAMGGAVIGGMAAVTPASAAPHGFYGRGFGGYHGGYGYRGGYGYHGGYGYRGGYYRGGHSGAIVGAGVLGLAVGAAIASPHYGYGYPGYAYSGYGYPGYAPAPAYGYGYPYYPACHRVMQWDPYYGGYVPVRVCN